ncbi:hypothetical protein O6H91_01G121500 [Diphasiastrum complanatum]|uniref:Uncharacterized protein n=1 Tax=Diphasiastrum complanatum TaxID=34168 RepID=A0ACC2EVT7_DIPCM|nr:hypothetical protein O6H91_01G121500 [Diphasiastrum complanatum]
MGGLAKPVSVWKTPMAMTTRPIHFLPQNAHQMLSLPLPFNTCQIQLLKEQVPRRRMVLRRAKLTEEPSIPSTPAAVPPDLQKHSEEAMDGKADQTVEQGSSSKDRDWVPVLPHVLTAAMANFLFGYHIGVVNGPLGSIAHDLGFDGDAIMEGFVVSIFLIGAFLGSLSGGILADKVGRRRTFQLDMLPMILGAALSASTQTVGGMLLGRFLVGLGIGVNTALVPLYISEVAPTKYRGALGSICQVGTCVGIIAALVIGIPAETDPHWWRTMFWFGTIPAAYLVVAMQFTAESPRWLAKVGRWEEAQNVIKSLWGRFEVEKALEELRNAEKGQQDDASWAELLLERNFKVAVIGGALFMLQQFAGINGVLYFSSLTFQDAGITNSTTASAVVGVANLVGALAALSLMDTQGRRKLLMGSYSGMAISMLTLVLALEMPFPEQFSHFLSITGTLMVT